MTAEHVAIANPAGPGVTGAPGGASGPKTTSKTTSKPRLDHVDAMRPVKQAGVVSTHSLLYFAPGAAISVGGALMLLHVTREAFLFISASMLTYSYYDVRRIGYRHFYRRRFVSVCLPYLCWTVVYFFVTLPGESLTAWSGLVHFGYLLGIGYYQLYYLIVIMQFYLAYPALRWLLRRTEGHHVAVVVGSLAIQVLLTGLMHWNVLPPQMRGFWATREITSYQFYLVAGMVAALHLDALHAWLVRNRWKVFAATCGAAAAAEGWYVAAHDHLAAWLGSGSDPLQPIAIPYNIGAIACLYLFGVWLVAPQRSKRIRAIIASGSDNAYSIYLAQMVFVLGLSWLGWRTLDQVAPWPLVAAGSVVIVVLGCVLLSSVLARTPLSVALTGRRRQRWGTWLPKEWRPTAAAPPPTADVPVDTPLDPSPDLPQEVAQPVLAGVSSVGGVGGSSGAG